LRRPLQPLRRSRRFPPAQRSPSRQPLPSLQPVLHRVRVPLRSRAPLFAVDVAAASSVSLSALRARAAHERTATCPTRHLLFIFATVLHARSRLLPLLLLPLVLCRSLSIESGVSDSRCSPQLRLRRQVRPCDANAGSARFRVPKYRFPARSASIPSA